MDACSNWEGNKGESADQFSSKDQLRDRRVPHTRKTRPYHSLLNELHILRMKHGEFYKWTGSAQEHQILPLELELRFQQMVFMFLKNFIFSNHGDWFEALNYIQAIAEMEAKHVQKAAADLSVPNGMKVDLLFNQWDSVVTKFLETIDQMIKPDLKEFCLGIVDQLLQGNSSREYEISEFIDAILLKLKDLKISRPNMIVPVKKQIETLEEILYYVCIIITRKGTNLDVNLQNFLVYFRPWVNFAAALVILYWLDLKDEELLLLVSPLLEKFDLSILELVEAYMVVIKTLKPSNISESLNMRETVGRFSNMVLENLIVSTDDHFEILREGLTLWIALLMDPPQANAEDEKLICTQTNILIDKAESLIRLLCLEKLGEDITKGRNILLNNFLEKMNRAKAKVTQLHVEIPGLSWKNVPQTNRRGFFDFLLENLQKKLSEANMFPFEKHLIAIVHQELSLLRPFLMDVFGLQGEHKELKDIWVQASNVAYLVDYVTDSCLSLIDVPIWSNLIHLSNAIEEIQFIKTEVSMFRKNDQVHKNRVISAKVNSKLVPPKRQQTNATTKDDVKVGFAYEEQRIIDRLIGGEFGLDIVGIVGMPGQGKTTLAQRVFQDSCVKLHFNKYAWCCISQAYDIKEILLDILKDVGEPVSHEQIPFVSHYDMANRLRKCLKGQRYLVVLDDMWDVKVWKELQLSFPDDNNGSRILLTSRYQNVPLEAKPHCCIVELYPFSFEESWNLLQIMVFEEDCCPPTLSDIGKMIAENCNGLPLSIVVVAGLLKKDKNVDSWKQISGSLKSHIASEGCMNLLDLSYTHLPDYLKPCFLYLGTFQEDRIIDAKQLIQLWIVEGFIQNDGMKSKEVVANEYLMDLVSRSLVFIVKRSSRYGVKECHVHDLLRELCLIKAKEERFLMVPDVSDHSSSLRCDHYRLCVHGKWEPFADPKPIVPSVRSLLVSGGGLCYSSSAPSFLKRFKLLRVLDLGHIFLRQTDFDEITELIHLQFLSIAYDFQIPSSIVKLFRLEVLRLRYFGIIQFLPIALLRMANLRHVFGSQCTIAYIEDCDKVKLELCPPLTNLETFTGLVFAKSEDFFFEGLAQKLSNILKLGVALNFGVHLSRYFPKLESLNLYLSNSVKLDFCPSRLDFPSTVKKLNLSTQFKLSGTMISSIGKLSNLEVLKLHADFEDERWNVEDDEFLKLKYLVLNSSIQEWNVSEESFPFLEQLVVKYCYELGDLPGRFGAINTLKRFEVCHCSDSVTSSFRHIVGDQMDSGNEGLQFSIS